MRLDLYGGFGEKGRTCLGVASGGFRILLDAGVKTSAQGTDEYYPAIDRNALCALDAIVVTHAHEDHIGALGWCIAGGFRGRIFMTRECSLETDAILASYASAGERALVRSAVVERIPVGGNGWTLGPLRVSTGRSGHMSGSVWCMLDDGRTRLDYCGDLVPSGGVFAVDPIPRADAIVIDASYGDDNATLSERSAQISAWISGHPQGCVLPTPLHGRSAELLALIEGPLALAPGMRDALTAQIENDAWLVPGVAAGLAARLAASTDWREGEALPDAALLCHDGMGMSGPSQAILAAAARVRHPTLFTGHVPAGSPGERMLAQRLAGWIRLPTHPTLAENVALVALSAATNVIGHSCETAVLSALKPHVPKLDAALATGDRIEL
jgi:glyoxylase-like metal-dependent hydrolase (beta-lactamase superfamily II)